METWMAEGLLRFGRKYLWLAIVLSVIGGGAGLFAASLRPTQHRCHAVLQVASAPPTGVLENMVTGPARIKMEAKHLLPTQRPKMRISVRAIKGPPPNLKLTDLFEIAVIGRNRNLVCPALTRVLSHVTDRQTQMYQTARQSAEAQHQEFDSLLAGFLNDQFTAAAIPTVQALLSDISTMEDALSPLNSHPPSLIASPQLAFSPLRKPFAGYGILGGFLGLLFAYGFAFFWIGIKSLRNPTSSGGS